MRTYSMVNNIQNNNRMPRSIGGKSKYQYNRGELDKSKIKKRMEKFAVDPTAMLKRGGTLREADRGRNRDRSRACGGYMGAMGTLIWRLIMPLYCCPRRGC